MTKTRILAFITLLLLGGQAMAASPSYNYVDLAYQKVDLDGLDGDGYALGFSGTFTQSSVFGLLRYKTQSFDENDFSLDWTVMDIGIGSHWALSPTTDVTLAGGFARAELDVDSFSYYFGNYINTGGSDSDTGFFIEPGLRVMTTEQLEFFASMYYLDVFDTSETDFHLGLRYYMSPGASLNLAYLNEEDVDGFSLGVRFNF